jgi:hypothetical protein
VLLVEDEPALRRIIARNLTSRGLEVAEAATVADALLELDSVLPDLIHPLAYLPKPFPIEALLRLVLGSPPSHADATPP